MKEILLLALLSFTLCTRHDYPIKCEDGLYEAKLTAIKHLTDKINGKYEIYVKGTCKGGMNLSSNSNVFYCSENYQKFQDDTFYKKAIKVGKSCKIDEECMDRNAKETMTCKGGKCEDKCGNKCEKNQVCENKAGSATDNYGCYSYIKEGETCNIPTGANTFNGYCTPGTTRVVANANGDYKCVKIHSVEKGGEVFSSGKNNVCKTGFAAWKTEGTTSKCTCVDITSETPCQKDAAGTYYHKVTYSNGLEETLKCEHFGDEYYPLLSKAQLEYYTNKIVDAFKKIKPDNIAKKEFGSSPSNLVNYLDDKKFKEKFLIYDNFNYLKAQKIINDKGEVEKNKKKCLEFALSTLSSSTLKMSIALALFALLL